eukprot:XP_014003580.1 PREDICTED: doublecortin domain-containing protein 5 isoform X2 [Salmo salar]
MSFRYCLVNVFSFMKRSPSFNVICVLTSCVLFCFGRDSHSRAHQKIKMHPTFKYTWQGNHEEDVIQNVVENGCSNTDQPAKNRLQQCGRSITQAHRQQFEFSKGKIVSCRNPCLAVWVAGHGAVGEGGVKAGSPLQLVHSNPSYSNQRWTLNEGERTLHLLANPELVLSVSMTTIPPGDSCSEPPLLTSCSVVLQKYKPYSDGAANQKWGWFPDLTVLSAFYTSSLDQEVTAANQASVGTACVSPEPLHQQGFSFARSGVSGSRVKVCPSCSTGLRGRGVLQKLPPGSSSLCCMASHNHQLSPTGHFRILKVHQTELSESAADVTLQRLDECLGVTEDGGCGAAEADAVPRGVQRSPDQAEREALGPQEWAGGPRGGPADHGGNNASVVVRVHPPAPATQSSGTHPASAQSLGPQ